MAKLVKKNTKGYNYKYADIAEVMKFLEDNGWDYYQYIDVIDGNDYVMTVPIINGEEQPARRGCRVVQATLKGVDNPAQEQGSAITYARRYSLLMAFGLATTDDDASCMSRPKGKTIKEVKPEEAEQYPVDKNNVEALRLKIADKKADEKKLMDYFGVTDLMQMNQRQWIDAMRMLEKK